MFINRFNSTTFLCLSQARTWIYNIICHGLFCVQWVKMRGDSSHLENSQNRNDILFTQFTFKIYSIAVKQVTVATVNLSKWDFNWTKRNPWSHGILFHLACSIDSLLFMVCC
jgi:hypothetical protein